MGFFIMKNVLKVVFVIIGTLIGAGFASGQEVYLFFFSYGMKGLIGILISSIIIGVVIYSTFNILNKYKINTYKDFLNILIPKNTKLKIIANFIINIFILITFFIMIAGFGAYFEQEIGINRLVGSLILAIITFIVFMTSIKGVVKVNELIVPILIGFIFIIGIISIKNIHILNLENYVIRTNYTNFALSAVLYSSYNSILLIPVLITLNNYVKNKKQIFYISFISAIVTILLSVIIFLLLVRVDVDISKLEMPVVYVVSNMFKILRYIYGVIILGSIFTTAISLGVSFLQNTAKNKKGYTQISIIMCITSVIISKFGFSNLVSLLYPIFGYLGLIQILRLCVIKISKVTVR
ncbi:putative uncharacterized protein [Clostridium sp. CAG:343]|jgi:uncharacterized membrane protein YkvI|nr:putative uncharacterized protein [Clostridium sp. CAG:343]